MSRVFHVLYVYAVRHQTHLSVTRISNQHITNSLEIKANQWWRWWWLLLPRSRDQDQHLPFKILIAITNKYIMMTRYYNKTLWQTVSNTDWQLLYETFSALKTLWCEACATGKFVQWNSAWVNEWHSAVYMQQTTYRPGHWRSNSTRSSRPERVYCTHTHKHEVIAVCNEIYQHCLQAHSHITEYTASVL